ncbi:uncharacterized protein LOC131608810 isoform X7 [Vicia villosa]|uniref:uncharacterized protein LOC131608810 isoform X7 n=1 Tax=Vicia villosa TaxID=3911 RepID=UPI00273B7677|nr:uncharacterized protein LOC131608810 isoform X7 [Vicia villosa]
MERGRRARARVVVLSDFGRSPKRQYHALPLANQALLEVDIVAYGGPEPHTELLANPSIHIHLMKQWSTARQSLPKKQERERREKEEKWKEKFKEKKSLDLRRFFSKSTHLHHLQLVYQVRLAALGSLSGARYFLKISQRLSEPSLLSGASLHFASGIFT